MDVPEMSLAEKVGQVLICHVHGDKAGDDARQLIQGLGIGGVIYYNWANGDLKKEEWAALSSELQALAKIPLIIAVDQEGGRVCRMKRGFSTEPCQQELSEREPREIYRIVEERGKELKAAGVTLNLAPVVDVGSGDRHFSKEVEKVTECAGAMLDGFHAAGIQGTLKHFPGLGKAVVDSHECMPVVHEVEMGPFFALAAKADAIMTAHVMVPHLDSEHCATLSENILTILRRAPGFNGAIISDSLIMGGVLEQAKTVDEAAICALKAGCDALILGGALLEGERVGFELTTEDVIRIHGNLVEAVEKGRIPIGRLNQAVVNVLKMKRVK